MVAAMKRVFNVVIRHIINAGGNLDHWVIAGLLSLLISLITMSIIHTAENHNERLDMIEARVDQLKACE